MSNGNHVASSIVDAFLGARSAGTAIASYPGEAPASLAQAYAVQDLAISRRGGRIAGWKLGRIAAPLSDALGANRYAGPVFADLLQQVGPGAVGRVFPGGFAAAEAEFVFRFGQAPEPGKRSFSLDEAAALIDAVYIGLEIAGSPFAGINASGPFVTISDFGNNNGLILGAEVPDWRGSGLESWTVTTWIDGVEAGSGKALAFPDGPLGSVRFLLENLAERGIAIDPGLLVSTGAVSGIHEVAAGQSVESRFGAMPPITCRLEAASRQA